MDLTTTFTTILSLVLVFLFAIQKFSHQIQKVSGEHLKGILAKWTASPVKAVVSGALVTSILQSSTATSVILVGLVNSGLIPAYNAIGAVVGANIGSTITAQLVALNMTYIAPIVVIAGFIISRLHSRFHRYGKAIFYFGVVFLSLFIISILIEPLKDNVTVVGILHSITNPYGAIVVGAVMTTMLQSSTLFTGLILILAANSLVGLPAAIGFMIGTAIGVPITAIIASTSASIDAKKVAIANAFFNILGVLIFTPFIYPFMALLRVISGNITQEIVNAHFIFNITCAILCLIFFKQFENIVTRITIAMYKK